MNNLKRYYVCHCAEGEDFGEIYLTPEQYEIVRYATDPVNWKNCGGDGYGGSFSITDADEEDEICNALL